MKNKEGLIPQFLRFGIVGVLCFGIDYGLLVLLTEKGWFAYIYSTAISYAISVIANYFLSMRFVFRGRENRNKAVEMAIFVILSMIGLFFNQLIMWIAVESFAIFYAVAKLLSTMIVTVFNFISRKIFLE